MAVRGAVAARGYAFWGGGRLAVAGAGLRLEVREFRDLTRWRWVLTDASGAFVADHEVRLNAADWQFEAFGDLLSYLRWHTAPDRRSADEARIVGEVGAWIGSQVLGAIGPALPRKRPAVVRVVVPPEASELLLRPLELAHVNGKPLSVQDVTLVLSSGADAGGAMPMGKRLRVLGLFSMPEGRRVLNLRRERQELVRLIEGIAATGKAADVRVLQYGVTREALRSVLEEAEGWDIVHVSGHGRPGSLLLETASGEPDLVEGAELADLLDLARERVKLVTVSACWSAAANEQRQMLGLPAGDDAADGTSRGDDAGTGTVPEALATGLTERLGCAVLAMRYPVGDDFAIALAGKLYELLAAKGQLLPRAVGMTLRELASASDSAAFPALSVATPALFGGVAADLRLTAPDRLGPLNYDTTRLKMAGFPEQALRFVGRTGVMARASSALTAGSGVPGVLLQGMPGGGKTACALELAYGHEHAFDRLVWYKAPDEGAAIDGSLTDFALTLERYLPDFQMIDALASTERLTAFLPKLTELVKRRRVLIIIDNLESLLSGSGSWRDERWGSVVSALCTHSGLGRVVLTSRRMPVTGVTGLRVESVDALSANETLLLVRELPHLQALGQGKVPGIDRLASRQLARRAIATAQGHPKLLELADGQAANPERLAALVDAGDQAWRKQGGLPEGFFTDGASGATGDDYLQLLAAWTKSVTDTLTPGERDLFWFLCCLEEGDRQRAVIDGNWADLRERLGREGEPTEVARGLAEIVGCGLVARQRETGLYAVHPGIAAAGRAQAGQPFQDAVNVEAAAYWESVYDQAAADDSDDAVDTDLMVRAGLAAAPYLIRMKEWEDAAELLEGAFIGSPTGAAAAAILPAVHHITQHDPGQADLLARVLQAYDPAAAETLLRAHLSEALATDDYRMAALAATRLVYLCLGSGRLAEALTLTEQRNGYSRRAGLGPWTLLGDESQRLMVLNAMGQSSLVLTEARRLRDRMTTFPADASADEATTPWNARESLLDAGREAARHLGRWADALDWNAAALASKRERRAPAYEIARAQFTDYYALLRLGRVEDAITVLLACREVFEEARDVAMLGMTFTGLADAEARRGHGDAAVRLVLDAIRYDYLAMQVPSIMASHYNLGYSLHHHARQPIPAFANFIAAALIHVFTAFDGAMDPIDAAAGVLREFSMSIIPPSGIADLCHQVGDIPGTDLPGLIARLSPDPETAERTLRELIAQAQALAAAPGA